MSVISKLRLAVGPCRSSTTAMANMLAQIGPEVTVFLRPLEASWADTKAEGRSYRDSKRKYAPDYRFYDRALPEQRKRPGITHVAVESVCEPPTFKVFRDTGSIIATKPLFLFRDPLSTWRSWMKNNIALLPGAPKDQGKSNFNDFVTAYRAVAGLCFRAKRNTQDAISLTSTHLSKNPGAVMKTVCDRWGIPFNPTMVSDHWQYPVDDNPHLVITDSERKLFGKDTAYLRTVKEKGGFDPSCGKTSKADDAKVTDEQMGIIDRLLCPLFRSLNDESVKDLPLPAHPTTAEAG